MSRGDTGGRCTLFGKCDTLLHQVMKHQDTEVANLRQCRSDVDTFSVFVYNSTVYRMSFTKTSVHRLRRVHPPKEESSNPKRYPVDCDLILIVPNGMPVPVSYLADWKMLLSAKAYLF